MFRLNQNVVYPGQGVGKIKSIEEKKVLKKKATYYVIEFVNTNMKIMIPVEKAKELGVRAVIKKNEVARVLRILKGKSSKMDDDWKSRYQHNTERIKTGSIFEIAGVARDLARRHKQKDLSLMERKMLDSALTHIITEISTVMRIAYEKAEEMVNKALP